MIQQECDNYNQIDNDPQFQLNAQAVRVMIQIFPKICPRWVVHDILTGRNSETPLDFTHIALMAFRLNKKEATKPGSSGQDLRFLPVKEVEKPLGGFPNQNPKDNVSKTEINFTSRIEQEIITIQIFLLKPHFN